MTTLARCLHLLAATFLFGPTVPTVSVSSACGPGSFFAIWDHGAADCSQTADPLLQVHAYDERTFIIRQSKCTTLQGPFVYLLLGQKRALLIDSGFSSDPADFPLQRTVNRIIRNWHASNGLTAQYSINDGPTSPLYEIVITHSHEHADHTWGDAQFEGQPGVTVVGTTIHDLQEFYVLPDWPSQPSTIDLGGRIVDGIPTPGHSSADISDYDRCSELLFTGDTMPPGYLLVFHSQEQFVDSIDRLYQFSLNNPIKHILGGHVEMTSTPGAIFANVTTYAPNEHVLQLGAEHLSELHFAIQSMGFPLVATQLDDYLLSPF
jgi:hydroxyacylglutathione hydrolase